MNTAAPAAFSTGHRCMAFQGRAPFVYLLLVGCVYPTVPSVSRCQHATGEEDTRFDHDMILSSCHAEACGFFLSLSPGIKQDGANFSLHSVCLLSLVWRNYYSGEATGFI